MILSHALRASLANAASTKTLTYVGSDNRTAGSTIYTFTAEPIGTATSDRVIVVGAMLNAGGARTVSSITLGGNAMTSIVGTSSASNCALFRISVATGTTADIVVTGSGASSGCFIVVYSLTGWGTVNTYASNSNTGGGSTILTTVDTAANGVVIGIQNRFSTNAITGTAGFGTQDVNTTFDSTQRIYSGNTNPTSLATGVTYSVTSTAATNSIAVVAFS